VGGACELSQRPIQRPCYFPDCETRKKKKNRLALEKKRRRRCSSFIDEKNLSDRAVSQIVSSAFEIDLIWRTPPPFYKKKRKKQRFVFSQQKFLVSIRFWLLI
jgi:hypothetical protein